VIMSSYLGTGTNVADPRAPNRIVDLMRRVVARNPRTVVVALGNPYLLQQVPAASTYVVTYGGFPMSQTAAARAILGRERITATLPISIPPLLPYGTGIRR
jgi:beta-N-acetylhexosaminidase